MDSVSFGLVRLLDLGLLVLVGWALVDAVTRPANAFVAAGKQTKQIWLAILGVCLLLCLIGLGGFLGFFGFVVAVAAIVYLVDVRPAVRGMRPGGPWG
jgi:NADH:ubiquinone oxidoreductase subunit 2 (subunit N)